MKANNWWSADNPFWHLSIDLNRDVCYQVKHRLQAPTLAGKFDFSHNLVSLWCRGTGLSFSSDLVSLSSLTRNALVWKLQSCFRMHNRKLHRPGYSMTKVITNPCTTGHHAIEHWFGYTECQEKKKGRPKNDLEWLAAQFSIISLALVKLQLGYVEHYAMRTLCKHEKN